jgi:hypothetical protein
MSAELLSPADATKTAALRTLQSIEVGYIFVDPSAASTDWPQQSKIVPCALAAGDTVTGYYAKSTFSISTLAIDAVGEVRGYRAQ